uniref:Uncharacterized protein n=1 Tax=Rhizophora mucronata TaxID=61149 RepID=A0A2P2N055_RHIMU
MLLLLFLGSYSWLGGYLQFPCFCRLSATLLECMPLGSYLRTTNN